MTRIVIDPLELAALAAMARNSSYDAAGIASEARHRVEAAQHALALAGRSAEASALVRAVDAAAQQLLAVAARLEDDSLLLTAIGHRTDAADAIADAFGGGEHALLNQLRADPSGGTP